MSKFHKEGLKMSDQSRPKFRKGSKAALYLELAKPDELGFSRPVSI